MNKFFVAIIIILVLFISNCTYEDGPFISLRSKTSRLVGEWERVSGTYPENNTVYLIKFDNDYKYTYQRYVDSQLKQQIFGTWEWYNDKNNIRIKSFQNSFEIELKRLTNKELWYVTVKGNIHYKYEKR